MDFRTGNIQLKTSEIALVLGILLLFAALFLIVVVSNLGIPLIAENGTETVEIAARIGKDWLEQSDGWIFSDGSG